MTGEQGQDGSPRMLKTVELTARILRALETLDSAGVTELADHLGTSKSTMYHYLATLRQEVLVLKNGARVDRGVVVEGLALIRSGASVGREVNFGAGTTVANLRHDDADVRTWVGSETVSTGRRKFGVVCGNGVKTRIQTSLNAGVFLPTDGRTSPSESTIRSPQFE